MSNPDLLMLIRQAEDHARRVLVESKGEFKQLVPVFAILDAKRELTLVATPWNGDNEKHLALSLIRAHLQLFKSIAYCVSSEAWLMRLDPKVDKPPYLKPSQSDRRIEVVVIAASHRNGDKMLRNLEIIRDAKARIIDLKVNDAMGMSEGEEGGRLAGDMPSLFD